MAIEKKDFVEIEYTGRLKEGNIIFDTTDEKTAKENSIYASNAKYGPIVVCVGEGHFLRGLDKSLEGREPGKHTIELKPEDAFGKKDAKLIQLVPTKKFFEQRINPVPGLQINFDGIIGVVRTVSGGRTIVDFNHPLSGKEVVYEVNIIRVVTDAKEKINALLKTLLAVEDAEVDVKEGKAEINLKKDLPEKVADELKKKIAELMDVKEVEIGKIDNKEPVKKEVDGAEKKEGGTNKILS